MIEKQRSHIKQNVILIVGRQNNITLISFLKKQKKKALKMKSFGVSIPTPQHSSIDNSVSIVLF